MKSPSVAKNRRLPAIGLSALLILILCSLLLSSSPTSDAQSNPRSATLALRGQEIWSATLTVGTSGRMLGYGEVGGRTTGTLSASEFTWRGNDYRVTNLFYNRSSRLRDVWSLVIDISPPLPLEADQYGCLSLMLGEQWFNLADGEGNGRQFFWYDIDLSWTNGSSIDVALREFPSSFEARSINGWGNNLHRPRLGMAGEQLLRQAAVGFDFAMSGEMDHDLPDARTISNLLHQQHELTTNAMQATDMIWQWGQFVDHDISLTPSTVISSQSAIPIPRGDEAFDPSGTGARFIPFTRSAFDSVTGTALDNPREQPNLITAFIDASNVYGSSNERAQELRTNDGTGRLRTSAGGLLLPPNPPGLEVDDGGRRRSGLFLAGDVRVNEQIALTAMHTLFVREHNRLAEELAAEYPDLTGHEVFEIVRKIVGAQMQVITYREFLPLLLGPGAIAPYSGYDSEVDPSIANEFSTAAFRVGHTMLSPNLMMIDADGQAEEISLAESFFNISLLRETGIEPLLRGVSSQMAQEVDLALIDDVRNMLFGPPGGSGRDLAALNIQRGRDHGLPRYNIVRISYGLAPANSFADVSSDPEIRQSLALAYRDVSELDLWTGGLAEDHVPGAMVGETFQVIIADQFRRLRDGDRFWFENDPLFLAYPRLLAKVRETTLADVIRRNTLIDEDMSNNVFGGGPALVRLSAPIKSVTEGNRAEFTLVRSGPTTRALSVQVRISEVGDVLSRQSPSQLVAVFLPGSDLATVRVSTFNDSTAEFDGTLSAAIVQSDEYRQSEESDRVSVTVLDDDSLDLPLESGMNTFRWSGPDGFDVGRALAGIGAVGFSSMVVGIFEWNEATSSWLAYFPALEASPGQVAVNTLTNLRNGHSYRIRTTQAFVWRTPRLDASSE